MFALFTAEASILLKNNTNFDDSMDLFIAILWWKEIPLIEINLSVNLFIYGKELFTIVW